MRIAIIMLTVALSALGCGSELAGVQQEPDTVTLERAMESVVHCGR